MRKIVSWVVRLVISIGMVITMSLTLSSNISMQVSTKGIVKEAINKTANQYGVGNVVKSSWGILNALGLEDQIFDQLPKNLKVTSSYLDLYNLAKAYQDKGEVSGSQLGLPYQTDQQKTISDLVTKYVNNALEQNKSEINQGINYYQMIFYAIIGLYLLGIILVLFGKRFGVYPYLLAALGGYAIIAFVTSQVQTQLQTEIYQGITVTMANSFNNSIVLAIIIGIIWFWWATIEKRRKRKQRISNKNDYQGKHAAS
ncbi:hypothetical protein [Lactobacillus sp. PV034]|uniref:hypothetical protein n=1 Tax=Lactobacillus sp. PV034 TaxID=2594495 RepID=UPI00223F3ED2|nr:hypothetical protein [Lactobacillus sp. PV034]QNQ80569.1 hypothetical protein FP432_02910 [Lactobacillus sp. PV034]